MKVIFDHDINLKTGGKTVNKMKRTLSAALAILMLAGTFVISVPFTASAARYSGSGSGTVASEEDTKAVEDATPYTELPTGGWVTPSKEQTYDEFTNIYSLLREAGVNFMITRDEAYSDWYMSKSLDSAYQVGMDIYLNPILTHHDHLMALDKFKTFVEFPNVKGIWFGDEPGTARMPDFVRYANALMRELDTTELTYGANLFPDYAGELLGEAAFTDYEEYIASYVNGTQNYDEDDVRIDKYSSDFVCVDYYVYDRFTIERCITNFLKVKSVFDQTEVVPYTYVKSSGGDVIGQATDNQILCNTNVNLALGSKGIVYYVACQQNQNDYYTAIVNFDGTKGTNFNIVQNVNSQIDAMKGVYLDFENEGLMTTNTTTVSEIAKAGHSNYVKSSYKQLSKVEGSNALVGCFTKGEGATAQTGLYVVNQNYNGRDNVTLNFNGSYSYQIWGADGLEQMGTDSKLVLPLSAGEGKFVIVNSVNDPDAYEAVIPEDEERFDHAHINGLLFDLEYTDNGTISNAKKNGVGIRSGATGATVGTYAGKTALSSYDFTLDYVSGLHSAAGSTVELDIMFTGSGNDKIFFDHTSNFNFYRLESSGEIYFGLPDYISDVHKSGLSSQAMANYFPKNEWLHIILTQSSDGQDIYVNGNKVISEKLPYDNYFVSLLEFVSNGDIKLHDAKIYTYAVDANEVKYMSNDRNGVDNNILGDFTDAVDGAWYTAALESMVRRGFVQGVTPTALSPDSNITRAQFVSILARIAAADLDNYKFASMPFSDVIKGQWHYKAIAWAYENGLVDGVTPTSFNPDGNITREQMAVLIVRFAQAFSFDLTPTIDEASFDDQASIGGWALESVKLCQTTGLVTGMNGSFVPAGTATRAQAAQIFVRMLNL